jgi:hypothetical protein
VIGVLAGARIPQLFVTAAPLDQVDSLRTRVERWAAATYGPAWSERLAVSTNQARVAQAAVGMRIFKILMGAITGVSLLVGGIGIMNVLLAAVAERTREIGVRKATGARNRDILVQFLAESVKIAGAGALAGVLLRLTIAFMVADVMWRQTNALVYVAITPSTVLFATGAALTVGLVFGICPALRAALTDRRDPARVAQVGGGDSGCRPLTLAAPSIGEANMQCVLHRSRPARRLSLAASIRKTVYRYLLRPGNSGGSDSAATIAPHAVITIGSTAANCGTASLSAFSTALVGCAVASTPMIATTAPMMARIPFGPRTVTALR